MSSLLENQAQAEANARLGSTGGVYKLVKELETIQKDTSPEIEQVCILKRKEFEVFQARTQAVEGANFPDMLLELNHFESYCAAIKEKHAAEINQLKQRSYDLMQKLIRIQGEIEVYVTRKPRIEYSVSDTRKKLSAFIDAYSGEAVSYQQLCSYINQAQSVIALSEKDLIELERSWQAFFIVQSDVARKLQDLKRTVDVYNKKSETGWKWAQKAYKRILDPAQDNYQVNSRIVEQLFESDVTVRQAINICVRLQDEIDQTLKVQRDKLEKIREQQEHFESWHNVLLNKIQQTTMFKLNQKDLGLIMELCTRAKYLESVEEVGVSLDVAERLIVNSVSSEEATRILNFYNLHIEPLLINSQRQVDNERTNANYESIDQAFDIFISYARTDSEIVQEIYLFLQSKGFSSWMDIHAIKGGENWLHAITKAINETEIFLAILSNNSVSKRGVVQKELKMALDKREGMLPSDIYIIPVRIDDCPIPDQLKDIHVLDWNDGKGKDKLIEAIKVGLERRRRNK